jgi:hypothetical protein
MAAAVMQAQHLSNTARRLVRADTARAKPIACLVPVDAAAVHIDEQKQLDEAELLRRKRISNANAGKVPWNKGRKHSAGKWADEKLGMCAFSACGWSKCAGYCASPTETIAKIKERTKQAMLRPEVQAAYKSGVAIHRAYLEATKVNNLSLQPLQSLTSCPLQPLP